jgi:hypothetical protein
MKSECVAAGRTAISPIRRFSGSEAWDERPTLLRVSANKKDIQLKFWAEAAGIRYRGSVAFDDRRDWSSETCDILVIDIGAEADRRPAPFLSLLEELSSTNIMMVFRTTLTMVETIMRWLGSRPAMILCEPSADEAVDCLTKLALTIGNVRSELGVLSRSYFREPEGSKFENGESEQEDRIPQLIGDPEAFACQIEELVRLRNMRDDIFGEDLFHDPVWNMLLDLMIARLRGRQIYLTSLCIAARTSETTALRLIGNLIERRILNRRDDEQDGRRIYVELPNKQANNLARWLLAAAALPRRCCL